MPLQLRDSAGLSPDFPRYLEWLLPIRADALTIRDLRKNKKALLDGGMK